MNVLNSRYITTLINAQVRVIVFGANTILISKFLGIYNYGTLAYILGIAGALAILVDLGTGSIINSKILKSRSISSLISTYATLVLFCYILMTIILYVINNLGLIKLPDTALLMVAIASLFMQTTGFGIVNTVVETVGRTSDFMKLSITATISYGLITLIFGCLDWLTIKNILIIGFVYNSILLFGVFKYSRLIARKKTIVNIKKLVGASRFLISISALSFLYLFIDRQIIQYIGGNESQASYTLGLQVAVLVISPIAAFGKIIWKDFTKTLSSSRNNISSEINRKNIKILFASTMLVIVGILLIEHVINSIYSIENRPDILVIKVAMIYTIHQALGQSLSMYALSINMSKTYAGIGVVTLILNSVLSMCYTNGFKINVDLYMILKNIIIQIASVEVLRASIEKQLSIRINRKPYVLSYALIGMSLLA